MTLPAPGERLPEFLDLCPGETMEAISHLDSSRLQYFYACDGFKRRLSDRRHIALKRAMAQYGSAFDKVVDTMSDEGTFMEYSLALGYLHLHQDNNRVDYLNTLLGTQLLERSEFEPYDEDDDGDNPFYSAGQIAAMKQQAAGQFKNFFHSGLVVDTHEFVQSLLERPAQEFKSPLRKHAIGIGGFALGIAAGILGAKAWYDQRK